MPFCVRLNGEVYSFTISFFHHQMEIYLKDQIVILDEAHNIEDSSREAASQTVSQQELKDAIDDLNKMIEMGHKVSEHRTIREMVSFYEGLGGRW